MAKPIHPSDPREMTEDEADFEVASRRESEPSIPLEEVLAKNGIDIQRLRQARRRSGATKPAQPDQS